MVAQKEGGCLSNASSRNHQRSLIMAEGLTDMQWVVVGPKGAAGCWWDTVRASHLKLVIKRQKVNKSTTPLLQGEKFDVAV